MEVLLVNGSPHEHGCTDMALRLAGGALEKEGVGTDVFWIGNKPLAGCLGCGFCAGKGRCRYDDRVNEFLDLAGSCGCVRETGGNHGHPGPDE